jgi:shikimate kinase
VVNFLLFSTSPSLSQLNKYLQAESIIMLFIILLTFLFQQSVSFHIKNPLNYKFSPLPKYSVTGTTCNSNSLQSLKRRQETTVLYAGFGQSEDEVYTELRNKLKGTCVYFIGMMGTGKSTLGKLFSDKLGYRFIDTDEVAEFMIEMPISEFFASGKVEEFRDMEYQILMDLAQYTRVVVATGGGIIERNINWGLLRHGIVVFLDMSAEDIYDRLSKDPEQIKKRPLLQENDPLSTLSSLLNKRMDKYTQADVTVSVSKDMSPSKLSFRVAQEILDTLAKNPPVWDDWKKKKEQNAIDFAMKVIRQLVAYCSFY